MDKNKLGPILKSVRKVVTWWKFRKIILEFLFINKSCIHAVLWLSKSS